MALRALVISAAFALAGMSGAAQAQASGGDSLQLVCRGTDSALMPMAPSAYYRNSYWGATGVTETSIAAQLSISVENGQVRVRPPKSSVPLFAKDSKDGWYELTDVSVDRLAINGRLKFNRIERAKLYVDRRTGAATFGDFSGICQVASTSSEATKF